MTDPMNDLRQASAEVSGVEVLSPAAQVVLDAVEDHGKFTYRGLAAAALRAAALHSYCPVDRQRLYAIAAELEVYQ